MSHPKLPELLKLDFDERLQLVEELWDSISEDSLARPLSEEQKNLLDERLASWREQADAGEPWETVRARILRSQ